MKKVILSLGVLAILMALVAVPALAAEAINEDTGYLSANFAVAADGSLIFVDNMNLAGIDNFSLALANSGFNWAGGPGGSNEVDSGNAEAETATATEVNDNFTAVTVDGNCSWDLLGYWVCIPFPVSGEGASARNSRTGQESLNVAVALDVDFVSVSNFNVAIIDNFSLAIANSGFNVATGPGGNNSVDTGKATASTDTSTTANTNYTSVAMGGGSSAEAVNEDTGYLSDNYAVAAVVDVALVDNINIAMVNNVSVAVANSGVNSAGGAGGSNEVDTGQAEASTKTETSVNDSATCVEMDGNDDASATNDNTGQESLNVAVAADVDVAAVSNVNVADVDNVSVAVANSGVNAATGDGGHNSVDTGNATASTETSTTANTNVTVIGGQ